MMVMAGFLIVYVIPACFAVVFWGSVRALFRTYEARDVMKQFRANPTHVHHTERLLRVTGLKSMGRRR